ncbi:hypothetical protein DAPPUDRAFT_305087 [Daphnia pulex]|uniref:CUB domain-containing protein n=1 Tax=Daphnia pulex TaxID=6669 RepID=E9GP05_DAPPU|nr:hypothetical protein DAPPUDRAFT_305087 [Daphnia pulex]|eukprot:EFX78847.1 hypothetical protein DAPPUDRAFT_305087 [Daphnia pulex]
MTKRLSQSNAFGTAIGSCLPDPGCGICHSMTTEGGTIESLNFPDEYPPDLNCLFTIQSPSYTTIQLTFTTFNVENCCDFVSVFDGTSNPLQVGLNGYTLPDKSTSTGTTMTIKFTTNSDNAQVPPANAPARWQATYTFQGSQNRFILADDEMKNQTALNEL